MMPEPIKWNQPQNWRPESRWTAPEPPTEPFLINHEPPTELFRPEWVLPGHGEPAEGTESPGQARSTLARLTVSVALLMAVVTCLTILAVDIRILVLIWQP